MTSTSLSVAMCTYNGMPYLPEQLESIARQSRLPNELVVCDDCSSDDTVAVLEAFAARAPFPVRIFRNTRNLRSTKNFEQAISLCTGDIIALADQDDVWLEHKLRTLEEVLHQHPTVGAVFSNAEAVDAQLHPLGYTIWDSYSIDFSKRRRWFFHTGRALEVLLRRNYVTGATLAFRAEYRSLVLPIQASWVHDYWIALLIAAVADLYPVETPLILYRIHPRQQIGASPPKPMRLTSVVKKGVILALHCLRRLAQGAKRRLMRVFGHRDGHARELREDVEQKVASLESTYLPLLERLRQSLYPPRQEGYFTLISEAMNHHNTRLNLPNPLAARLPIIAREVISRRYHRYSTGYLSALRDLLR